MNIQNMMREAQKVQNDITKIQSELEKKQYVGSSSLVSVTINGKHEITNVKINSNDNIENDELEILEDMILVAVNDAINQANSDKESKLGKYSNALSGLL